MLCERPPSRDDLETRFALCSVPQKRLHKRAFALCSVPPSDATHPVGPCFASRRERVCYATLPRRMLRIRSDPVSKQANAAAPKVGACYQALSWLLWFAFMARFVLGNKKRTQT